MIKDTDFYTILNADKVDSPFLAVYPERIKANIQLLMSLFNDKNQIRPHVKTHKCPEVVQLCLDTGITKFKCATIAEAEMLALTGARDILMAYQPVGPKLVRFLNLMTNFPDCNFSCLVDNQETAQLIAEEANKRIIHVKVWIDVNVGMNRTGILPVDAKQLYNFCGQLPNLEVIGLHAYDGQIIDPDRNIRMAQAEEGFSMIKELRLELPELLSIGISIISIYIRNSVFKMLQLL